MAGALVKGGSKLVPALMTGIGAAGTILQSKKNIDPMDFGKSNRSEEEKDYARNRRKAAGLGKKKVNVQGRNQKMQGKNAKNKEEVKDTKEKATSSKGFGEKYYDWRSTLDEKCWAGYEKKGMKTMFGKRYPNCVKKSKKKK